MTRSRTAIRFSAGFSPLLLTAIHTEEEFDWSKPFNRSCTDVTHLRELGRAQEIFTRLGVHPCYLVDYPVAHREKEAAAIGALLEAGTASIGAHLHPWVNPPLIEKLCRFNSYPGNLAGEIETAKLLALTKRIEQNFSRRPTVYLAGRYGFGDRTLSVLQELGYRIDLSAVAGGDFRSDGGPDFRSYDSHCFWEGTPRLLRIPHSSADVGLLCRDARRLFDAERSRAMRSLRFPGILARIGAVRRIRLTPEGFSLRELIAGAQALIHAGVRILVFSFHSPSLAPGFTPYVRDRQDRDEFLQRIHDFLRIFRDEFGGRFAGPETVLAAAECA